MILFSGFSDGFSQGLTVTINASYYYQRVENSCAAISLENVMFFQDSLMNRKRIIIFFKYIYFL